MELNGSKTLAGQGVLARQSFRSHDCDTKRDTSAPVMPRPNTSAKTHYFRRGNTYVYRRRVPLDVRSDPVFGGKEHHQESLKTVHPTQAARAAAKVTDWFDTEVRRVRGTSDPESLAPAPLPNRRDVLSKDDLEGISARWLKNSVDTDLRNRLVARSDPDGVFAEMVDQRDSYAHGIIASFNDPVHGTRNRQRYIEDVITPEVAPIVRGKCKRMGIADQSPDYFGYLDAIVEAEILVLEHRFARQDGSPSTEVRSDALQRGLKMEERRPEAAWSITELAQHCLAIRAGKPSWSHKVETAAKQFDEFLGGGGRPISSIKSVDVKAFVQTLLNCPVRADLRFPGVDIKAAGELNRARGGDRLPTISPNTIKNTQVAVLRWLLSYAHQELEAIPTNPAANIKIAGSSKLGGTRTRFETEELQKLFQLPVFTGCLNTSRPGKPGHFIINDHRFWAPLVLLFTGARPSEVAQLAVSDVKLGITHPYLSILTEYDPSDPEDRPFVKSGKTINATRVIPIHPELVRLGFAEYVFEMRRQALVRLFPEWKLSSDARKLYSQASWIRAFNEKYIPLVSTRHPRPTFYSFRHTFKSRLIAAGVPTQIQNQVLGHAQTGMDGSYFADGADLADVASAVAKINHEGLSLEHLIRRHHPYSV